MIHIYFSFLLIRFQLGSINFSMYMTFSIDCWRSLLVPALCWESNDIHSPRSTKSGEKAGLSLKNQLPLNARFNQELEQAKLFIFHF